MSEGPADRARATSGAFVRLPAVRRGPDDRPARRLVQSAARGPSADFRTRAAPAAAGSALVARHARQSAEIAAGSGRDARADRGRAALDPRSAHRRHRLRGARSARATPTIRFDWLRRRAPGVRFVWIMGADNLDAVPPLAALARNRRPRARSWSSTGPGSTLRALSSRAAQALARWRRPERDAGRFATPRAARATVPARAALPSILDRAAPGRLAAQLKRRTTS